MKNPAYVKPALWGAVGGAAAMLIVGFGPLGWRTAGGADQIARQRASEAVVAALVPFCVANAKLDADRDKLMKLRGETSPWSRTQLVYDSGWATMLGTTAASRPLAEACSERLQSAALQQ